MGYIVRYKREAAFDWTSTPVTSSTTLRLEGLTEGASYYVQVTAVCSSEQSTPSNTFIFTTTIQCPATQVTSVDVTPTRARVNWAAITAGATGYIVRFKKDSESDWTTMPATTSTTLLLGDLTVSTLYNVQVITVCYFGQSSPSNTVNFTTLSSACPEPTQFYPINISSNGATINWSAVPEATGYIVQYRANVGNTWTSSPIVSSTDWALQGLTAGIWYNVQVMSVCAFGQSKLTNTASFRTSTALSGPNTVSMSGLTTTKASSSQKMGQHSDRSNPDILKRSFDIVLSPNPTTTGKVYVNIESTDVGDVYVKVCDILGHVVWQNALTLDKGSLIQQEIDISDRKNGLYFIHLTDGKGLNTVKRLVVQR
jgi:titin